MIRVACRGVAYEVIAGVATLLVSLGSALAIAAESGEAIGHASAIHEDNACETAKLAALQNAPAGAHLVDGECSCTPRTDRRMDCWAKIHWALKR